MNTQIFKFQALIGSTLIFTCCTDNINDQIVEKNISTVTISNNKESHSLEEIITVSGVSKESLIMISDTTEIMGSWSPVDSSKSSFFGSTLDIGANGVIQKYETNGELIDKGKWLYSNFELTIYLMGSTRKYVVAFIGNSDSLILMDPNTKQWVTYERILGC